MHVLFDAKTLDSLVAKDIKQPKPRHCIRLAAESDEILQCIRKLLAQKKDDDGTKELAKEGDRPSLSSRLHSATEQKSAQYATLSGHTLWNDDDSEWELIDARTL